jgi:hypothetical protein
MEQLQSHRELTASSYMGKYLRISSYINPFAPAAKRLSDRPENLHMGWKKIKNKNTF